MTHLQNIPHILQYGITHRSSTNANPDFVPIGDASLISTRASKTVYIDNGIHLNAGAEIELGDYIPFYFWVKMPMLLVIQNGGNFVPYPTSPENIIYLVCSVIDISQSGNIYYFSDGHATDRLSSFFDQTKLNDLPKIVDFDAVKSSYWGGHENLNVKRKKQAEFLVKYDISPELIIGFGCYNEQAKNKLLNFGIANDKIKIIPQGYF